MTPQTHRSDPLLIGLVLAASIIGLIVLSSASAPLAFDRYGDNNAIVKKQTLAFLIGLVSFVVVASMDYRTLRRFALPAFIASLVLLFAVFIPGLGAQLLGAKRWISIEGVFFQPSEFVKLTLLLYLAVWIERRGKQAFDLTYGFLPFVALIGGVGLLLILQPDVGTTAVIGLVAFVMYFVAGAKLRSFVWVAIGGVVVLAILTKLAPYRAARFAIFLNPELDPQGIGYHVNQALLAIGSGGLFGRGLGQSIQKFNFLPEAAGDSIFAVMAEELGFLFTGAFLLIVLFLILRGLRAAREAPDTFGRLLATGIASWFGIQTFVNIAALTNLLPLTGIPLPFVSNGGSALFATLTAAGILVSISRYGKH